MILAKRQEFQVIYRTYEDLKEVLKFYRTELEGLLEEKFLNHYGRYPDSDEKNIIRQEEFFLALKASVDETAATPAPQAADGRPSPPKYEAEASRLSPTSEAAEPGTLVV